MDIMLKSLTNIDRCDVNDMANYYGQSQHNSMTLCTANRGCGLRFGAPLIEKDEYD